MSFAAELLAVSPEARDAWLDRFLGFEDALPVDDRLAPGLVPYMPTGVATLLSVIEHARVTKDDIFVDIGCGIGRPMAVVHLMTGARTIGVEIQPHLASRTRDLAQRLGAPLEVIEGDATKLVSSLRAGTIFFLYCPFSGDRLDRFVDELEPIARAHPIRICAVDVPLPRRDWLVPVHASRDLEICRST